MSCCPSDSWPALKNDPDYVERGTVEQVGDLPIYKVGRSEKCIIWNYDVMGFKGGRTRQLCDQLAERGYMVLLPDYYRGQILNPTAAGPEKVTEFIKKETGWKNLKKDWTDLVKPYAEKEGAKVFGTVGTCWGSYPVIKLSALPEFKAGVSIHPSHTKIMDMLNEDEMVAYNAIRGKAQLFMPAVNDDPNTKAGGLAEKTLGKDLVIIEFTEMQHGWVTRGDLTDPKSMAEVHRAMEAATEFFDKHL